MSEDIIESPCDRRVPLDLAAYSRRSQTGPCFICAIVAGDPAHSHEEIIFEDDRHFAFLARYATLPGYVLVAPKAHVEHVVRDLDEQEFVDLMRKIRKVSLAVEATVPCERTYLLSLGSQQGNAHLHWHVAALPPGVPYERQQYHALMAENGIIDHTPEEASDLATRIRTALATLPG